MKRALLAPLFLAACSLGEEPSEPPRPPDAVDVTMEFCDESVRWFAYKNDDFNWVIQPVFIGQTEFTFPARSRVTVVTGTSFATTTLAFSSVTVRNLSQSEADAFNCRATPFGLSTMGGGVASEQSADLTIIQMGEALDFVEGTQSYALTQLGQGTLDLVAINRFFADDTSHHPRVIVRNNITVANGASMPTLDFTSSEAKEFGSVRITRTDSGNAGFGLSRFETSRKTRIPLQFALGNLTASDTAVLPVVPSNFVKAGDLHRFELFIPDRGVTFWMAQPKDTAITYGPTLGTITIDTVTSTAAMMRQRARVASQTEYPSMAEVTFAQVTSSADRSITVITTAGYLGATPTEWELEVPDLRGVVPDVWILRPGPVTTWLVTARNARSAVFSGVESPTAGETLRYATKQGQ